MQLAPVYLGNVHLDERLDAGALRCSAQYLGALQRYVQSVSDLCAVILHGHAAH